MGYWQRKDLLDQDAVEFRYYDGVDGILVSSCCQDPPDAYWKVFLHPGGNKCRQIGTRPTKEEAITYAREAGERYALKWYSKEDEQ